MIRQHLLVTISSEHKMRGKSNKLEEKKWCAKTKVMIKAMSKQG